MVRTVSAALLGYQIVTSPEAPLAAVLSEAGKVTTAIACTEQGLARAATAKRSAAKRNRADGHEQQRMIRFITNSFLVKDVGG